ncbi:hypothetical protein R84B8_02937 [Treponema sp. R8-4-B8]
MGKKILFAVFIFSIALNRVALHGQQITEASRTVDYIIRDNADYYGNKYLRGWTQYPTVLTFVNGDGSVTVCSSNTALGDKYGSYGVSSTDEPTTYIYEYDINLQEQKTLTFKNELGHLGAFTKDNDGNYYFFYAVDTTDKNKEIMTMVKYNREGEKLKTYKLKAQAPSSFDGIRVPYAAGSCRLELSGSMLAVYFAREMFSGHQASYGFVLDKDTFERIDKGAATNAEKDGGYLQMPYVSHSFNQFILPIENGFVFADHGDSYPRAFTFAKFQKGSNTIRQHAFAFPGRRGETLTYAEMGGLAKTSSGYIFTGTYGREQNNPRNLFALTFDEEMKACSSPIYLTKYTKNAGHAGHSKIAALNDGRYLLLWEFFSFSTQSAFSVSWNNSGYISTYMLFIDEQGKPLTEPHELKGIRLSMNDTLRYNPHNGKVYWAINEGDKKIKVYALETKQAERKVSDPTFP